MRSTISIKNRTNYFDPTISKICNTVMNPDLYMSKKQKIEAYESRLYYEFLDTQRHNGATYFYTLTYNDAHVPQYDGKNVFDYEDLRSLLHGAFYKKLERNYHCAMKYFVGAELGEGKGKRGYANNPHYHVLFFIKPEAGYSVIDKVSFCNLVQTYWQGFVDGQGDYQQARFGIARPGSDYGLVNSFQAVTYVAKYVTKDIRMKDMESQLYFKAIKKYYDEIDLMQARWLYYSRSVYPSVCKQARVFDQKSRKWISDLPYSEWEYLEKIRQDHGLDLYHEDLLTWYINNYYRDEFESYIDTICRSKAREDVKRFRNRHSNKVRVSQGVGDYALEFIDPTNPVIKVPSKKGMKERNICGYYFRKIYYDVVKDAQGQNLYVLNNIGRQYKTSILAKQIERHITKSTKVLSFFNSINYKDFIEKYAPHFKDKEFDGLDFHSIPTFIKERSAFIKDALTYISTNKQDILLKYAEYKTIYEGRSFTIDIDPEDAAVVYPTIDTIHDYEYFLTPTYFTARYCPGAVDDFILFHQKDVSSYGDHPYFSRYIDCFRLLDDMADYYTVTVDEQARTQAEERERLRKHFNQFKFRG